MPKRGDCLQGCWRGQIYQPTLYMHMQCQAVVQVTMKGVQQNRGRCSRHTCSTGLLDVELQAGGVAEQEGLVACLVTLPAEEEHLILQMHVQLEPFTKRQPSSRACPKKITIRGAWQEGGQAGQGRAQQRTGQGAGQVWAGQGRAGLSRAGPNRAATHCRQRQYGQEVHPSFLQSEAGSIGSRQALACLLQLPVGLVSTHTPPCLHLIAVDGLVYEAWL